MSEHKTPKQCCNPREFVDKVQDLIANVVLQKDAIDRGETARKDQLAQEAELVKRDLTDYLLVNNVQKEGYVWTKAQASEAKSMETDEPIRPMPPTVTQQQFEQSVMEKAGRISDLATRLQVDKSVIEGFLKQPNAKVSVQALGWIKPKPGVTAKDVAESVMKVILGTNTKATTPPSPS